MIATSPTNNQIITEKIDLEITKTIFCWHSTYEWQYANLSPDCHCLLRIYWLENHTQAVVIASELHSNRGNTDIYHGYPDLVKAVINSFPKLQPILSQITWLTHFGQFTAPLSWAESHQRDTFRELTVQISLERQSVEVDERGSLELKEVIGLLEGANLEPAVEVLRQLQHDNGWRGGIVDEEQVKNCLELEQGIILGQKREKGLVGL